MALQTPGGLAGTPIIILKEGSTRNQGKDAQARNIQAARIITEVVKATLGPRGMDKMLVDTLGDVTITNDGHEILKEIDVEHPIAKLIVEIAETQDDEVGDGTTTAVLLAGDLLQHAQTLLEKNVHATTIVAGYRKAAAEALKILQDVAIDVDLTDRPTLKQLAVTSMSGKVIGRTADHFANVAIDAVQLITDTRDNRPYADKDDIQLVKKTGKSLFDTQLIHGIILDKEVVHPDMPKRIEHARIGLLDCPLEIKKTEMDAEIRIRDPLQMKAFLDEEARMLAAMVHTILTSGANVILGQKGIDDLAQHHLTKASVLAVQQIKASDIEKLAKATGARVISTIDDLTADDLGVAQLVEERKIGDDKLVFIEGCQNPKAVAILIRAGLERLIDEAERALIDAVSVMIDVVKTSQLVAGGGSIEAELAKRIRDYAVTVGGREQLAIEAFAQAIEIIPITLAENAGFDIIDILVAIRAAHDSPEGFWYGVNVASGKVEDMMKNKVLEPLVVKQQAIKSAVEAAAMILRIDDIIASTKTPLPPPKGGYGGMPPY